MLFFIPTRDDAEKRLMRAVESLVPRANVRIYRNLDGFRRKLLFSHGSPSAVVILAVTIQDLLSIVPIRDLLLSLRVIVVLPDSDDVTLAIGWGIWPRFVSYADGDLRDVAAVLGNIVVAVPDQEKAKGASRRGPQASSKGSRKRLACYR